MAMSESPWWLPFEAEYLKFHEVDNPGRKTRVFRVHARRSGDVLGHIRWYGAWRQYCFWPEPHTIFNRGCMNDINRFITEQMDARK